MIADRLEAALYKLGAERAARELFVSDPESFGRSARLARDELDLLRTFDVRALQELGVNPMLTMGFWQRLAPSPDLGAYVASLTGVDRG